jgi:glutaredoxin-like YruB-family protein
MEQKTIEIYSTPSCHYCHAAKEFFTEKGITFTDYNVAQDLERRNEMVEMTGQMGVPVIRIGDDVIVGFDQKKVVELLGV